MVTRRTSKTIRRPRAVITQTSSSTRLSRSGRGRGKIIRTRASSFTPLPRTFRKPAPPIRISTGTKGSTRPARQIRRIPLGKPVIRQPRRRVRKQAPPSRLSSVGKPIPKTIRETARDIIFDVSGLNKIQSSPEFQQFRRQQEGTVITSTAFPNRKGGVDIVTPQDTLIDRFAFGITKPTQQQGFNVASQFGQAVGFREQPIREQAFSALGSLLGFSKKPKPKVTRGFIKKDREPRATDGSPRAIGGSALLSIDGFRGNPRFIGRFGTRFF